MHAFVELPIEATINKESFNTQSGIRYMLSIGNIINPLFHTYVPFNPLTYITSVQQFEVTPQKNSGLFSSVLSHSNAIASTS